MSIAYSSGEPSGIGPDIAVIYAQRERSENLQVYCDPDVLLQRAKLLNLSLSLTENSTKNAGELSIFPVKAQREVVPGKLDPNNAESVEYAMATRFQADKDLVIIKNVRGSSLDPSSDQKKLQTAKMGIDATRSTSKRPEGFEMAKIPKIDKIKLEKYFK